MGKSQYAEIYLIIPQGDFMEERNPVLGFSWEKDIQNNLPACFTTHSEETLFRVPKNPMIASSLFVQADPEDNFEFYDDIAGKRKYRVTKELWRYTIDTYLFHHYQIAQQRDEDSDFQLFLTDKHYNAYDNYIANSGNSKKQFYVDIDYFRLVTEGSEQSYFKSPKFTVATYLNILFRTLFCRADSYNQQKTVYYDGLLVRNTAARALLPKFSIEDYIEHEYQTGISLSIEITAVLLEFSEERIMKKAFEVFAEQILPQIVKSPLIYTRNAVARSFFQQILMELEIQRYRWSENESSLQFSDCEWEAVIKRAMMHCNVLSPPIYTISIPREQQQGTLEHLQGLFAKLEKPVNIVEYVESPKYGLAAFCVPEHPNVNYFLEKLNYASKNEPFEIPRCQGSKDKLFTKVHQRVLHMIYHNYKDSTDQ